MFHSKNNLVQVGLVLLLLPTIVFAADNINPEPSIDTLINDAKSATEEASAAVKLTKDAQKTLIDATAAVDNTKILKERTDEAQKKLQESTPEKAKLQEVLKTAEKLYKDALDKQETEASAAIDVSRATLKLAADTLVAAAEISQKLGGLTGESKAQAEAAVTGALAAAKSAKSAAEVLDGLAKKAASEKNVDGVVSGSRAKSLSADAALSELESQLKDWGFAPGLGVFVMNGAREVKTAVSENGILRAEFEPKQRIGVIFEGHFLFWGTNAFGSNKRPFVADDEQAGVSKRQKLFENIRDNGSASRHDFSAGISVCTELGTNGIRSAGIGPVFSWRNYHFNTNKEANVVGKPFNLGIYYITEPRVKTLANGMSDGASIPTGTAVRFDEKSRNGFAVVFSATL